MRFRKDRIALGDADRTPVLAANSHTLGLFIYSVSRSDSCRPTTGGSCQVLVDLLSNLWMAVESMPNLKGVQMIPVDLSEACLEFKRFRCGSGNFSTIVLIGSQTRRLGKFGRDGA